MPAYSVEGCRKSEDDGKPNARLEVGLAEGEAEAEASCGEAVEVSGGGRGC
jgi:hypothetical protein